MLRDDFSERINRVIRGFAVYECGIIMPLPFAGVFVMLNVFFFFLLCSHICTCKILATEDTCVFSSITSYELSPSTCLLIMCSWLFLYDDFDFASAECVLQRCQGWLLIDGSELWSVSSFLFTLQSSSLGIRAFLKVQLQNVTLLKIQVFLDMTLCLVIVYWGYCDLSKLRDWLID